MSGESVLTILLERCGDEAAWRRERRKITMIDFPGRPPYLRFGTDFVQLEMTATLTTDGRYRLGTCHSTLCPCHHEGSHEVLILDADYRRLLAQRGFPPPPGGAPSYPMPTDIVDAVPREVKGRAEQSTIIDRVEGSITPQNLAVTATGNRLALAAGYTISFYRIPGLTFEAKLTLTQPVSAIAAHPLDERRWVAASGTEVLLLHHQDDAVTIQSVSATQLIDAVQVSPDGKLIAATTRQELWIWEAQSGRLLLAFACLDDAGYHAIPTTLAWDPATPLHRYDGYDAVWTLATGGQDGFVHLWRLRDERHGLSYERLSSFDGYENIDEPPTALAFNPTGEILAVGNAVGSLTLYSMATGRHMVEKAGHWDDDGSPIHSLAWSSDGMQLVSAGENGVLCLWHGQTGRRGRRLSRDDGAPMCCVQFVPSLDQRLQLISADAGGVLRQWALRLATKHEG